MTISALFLFNSFVLVYSPQKNQSDLSASTLALKSPKKIFMSPFISLQRLYFVSWIKSRCLGFYRSLGLSCRIPKYTSVFFCITTNTYVSLVGHNGSDWEVWCVHNADASPLVLEEQFVIWNRKTNVWGGN